MRAILLDWHGLIFEILWLKHLLSLFNAFIYLQKMMPRQELCGYLTCEVREFAVKFNQFANLCEHVGD
jgi:hypothetical protein